MDILADTSILLRRVHRGDPQHRQTRDAINHLTKQGRRLCVTTQNLFEFWAVCTRPVEDNGLGLTPAHADRVLDRVERSVLRLKDSDSIYPVMAEARDPVRRLRQEDSRCAPSGGDEHSWHRRHPHF